MSTATFSLIRKEGGFGTQSESLVTKNASTETKTSKTDADSTTNEATELKVIKRANQTTESEQRLKQFVSESELLISTENRVTLNCDSNDSCVGETLETVKTRMTETVDDKFSVSAVSVTCNSSYCLIGYARRESHESPCYHSSMLRAYSLTRESSFFEVDFDVH